MTDNIKPMGIKIDDGRRRVPITNEYDDEVGVFYFNPTDINIIERFNKLAKDFENILEPLTSLPDFDENADENSDNNKLYREAMKISELRLNKAVNELFGGDAASTFFGQINPFSPVDGKFYCELVLESVGRYISEQFKKETEKISNRVEKYTGKYKRRK